MVVYHEHLPEGLLLILAPGQTGEPEAALAHWLNYARRSGQPAVWVDCGLLRAPLSDEAAGRLRAAHHQLREQYAHLVLVHVPEGVKNDLLRRGLGPCMVPPLLDAARQAHWHSRPAAA